MVFVNDKKYACETCIKGHRSSTCNHTERPLFEIKKKGRPITQCEHCRELRKTKQVHVKCLCEGRDDPDAISHSIPAKKANRKGPTPSAAFPFGLHGGSAPASDSEDVSSRGPNKSKAVQRNVGLPPCTCKKGGSCSCCTPRHAPRAKRSATPPTSRPKIGDIRATAPTLHRPSSDPGDAHELSQRLLHIEPEQHALIHGHGARLTHGSVLFNPYGHAHDAHLRAHDMRGHEAAVAASLDASNGYIYPVPPISYDQQQTFGTRSESSPAWPNGERLSDDVNNVATAYDTQDSASHYGALDFGPVDVDAWLREIMASNSNSSPRETDISSANSSANFTYTEPRHDQPQALRVPQSLDVSRDLAQAQDPEFATAPNQFDLLPRLGNLDLDYNDAYLSGSDQDVGDVNGMNSTTDMFESELFNYAPAAAAAAVSSAQESASELVGTSTDPFSSSAPPMLTIQQCGNGEFRFAPSAVPEPKPQEYAFDYLSTVVDADYVARPNPGLPALTRSSSIGSHSSGRSRSSLGMSYWAQNSSSDNVNANSSVSDQWHSTEDNTSCHNVGSAEGSWALPAFPSVTETARGWPASRVQPFAPERGRTPSVAVLSASLPSSKDVSPTSAVAEAHPSLSFN